MPRSARYNFANTTYHVISRFVDRDWFFSANEERQTYLRMLGCALAQTDWRCLAYALMSNHIHLAMVAGEAPMSSWTKAVNSPFASYMNKRHDRLGPLFAGRGKDYGAVPHKEGQLIAYIHNNPVRAGLVRRAAQSDWSSHRAYSGLATAPVWLHVEEGLRRAGFTDRQAFDTWVDITPGESHDIELEKQRRAVRARGAIVLGTPTIDGDETAIPLLARPFAHIRPDPRLVVEIVEEVTQVPRAVLGSRRRNPTLLEARRIAAHAGNALGLTPSEIADALGISASAVSKHGRAQLSGRSSSVLDEVLVRCRLKLRRQVA
ncbi:MAG: transposase [Deltaproteobacteria bacterium]|nr:transposase [Deltaproteobacteria bacterium]